MLAKKKSALEVKRKALIRVSHLKQHYKEAGKNNAAYQDGLVDQFVTKAKNTAGKTAGPR